MSKTVWPKTPPPLSPAQEKAREEFMHLWHEELPQKYQIIENFNHGWVAQLPHKPNSRTLEIGAGIGGHLPFEKKDQEYFCLELRQSFCDQLGAKLGRDHVLCSDIQKGVPLKDHSIDRVVAIHTLEHMPALPDALKEVHRLLTPDGLFDVVIPCEGGLAHRLARKISAQRLFEKRFKMSFTPIMQNEHVNTCFEILDLLKERFILEKSSYFPLFIPIPQINLAIGLRLHPRANPSPAA